MAIVEMDFARGGSELIETVLWTNPNPSTQFAGQTITIDTVNGYKYIKFVFRKQHTLTDECPAVILSVEDWRRCSIAGGYAAVSSSVRNSQNSPAYHRYISYSSDTSIAISNDVSSANGYNIPYQIIGLK